MSMPARNRTLRYTRTWQGGRISAALRPAVPVATSQAAELLSSLSAQEVPVQYGDLLNSRAVIAGTEQNPTSALVYDSVYAAVQHEREDYQHDDGKAHYVSDPMRANRAALYGVMAKIMRGAMQSAAR